jgi:hypothetical protein
MGWAGLSLVSDAELGQLEPEAVAAGAPWGAVTWTAARAEAKRTLKIWLEADFPGVVGIADRVVDKWTPDFGFAYTGGGYTTRTGEISDDNENDLTLSSVFVTPASDRLYIGAAWEFEGLAVLLKDALNAAASVLTAKYSGPAGWTALTATDGTAATGATFAKSGRITWTLPTDWQRTRLNGTGDEYYWVELSVSSALTAGTKASQILPVRGPDGLKRIAAYLALHHILNGLAAGAAQPAFWQDKANTYLAQASELYGRLKANSGLWLDLNRTEAVTQEERVSRPVFLGRA